MTDIGDPVERRAREVEEIGAAVRSLRDAIARYRGALPMLLSLVMMMMMMMMMMMVMVMMMVMMMMAWRWLG